MSKVSNLVSFWAFCCYALTSGSQPVSCQAYRRFLEQDKDRNVPSATWAREPLQKPPFTLSRNTDIRAHTLSLGELWCELQVFAVLSSLGSPVWAAWVLASLPLLWKRLNKQAGAQNKAARSSQPHLWGEGGGRRFLSPWDSTDGSFIRLGVKVAAGECFH